MISCQQDFVQNRGDYSVFHKPEEVTGVDKVEESFPTAISGKQPPPDRQEKCDNINGIYTLADLILWPQPLIHFLHFKKNQNAEHETWIVFFFVEDKSL